MTARRNAWIVVAAATAVMVVGAAFALGTMTHPPSADAGSRQEALVTVPVERRTLTADVTGARGTFAAGTELAVPAPATDGPAVVTRQAFAPGDEVLPGDLLGEVSGRPVIGLATPFRLYRDIEPGDTGPDVEALQRALRDLDLFTGVADGVYGTETAVAVRTLYVSLGYQPLVAPERLDAVAVAGDALDDALRAQEAALQASYASPDAGARIAATADDVADARQALADAEFGAQAPLRVAEVALVPEGRATVLSSAGTGTELSAGSEGAGGGGATGSSGDDDAGSPGGDLVRLLTGEPAAVVRVSDASEAGFRPGAMVEVRSPAHPGQAVVARVSSLSGHRPGDAAAGTVPGYDATLVFGDGETGGAVPPQGGAPAEDGVPPEEATVPEDAVPDETAVPFEDGAEVVAVSRAPVAPKAEGPAVPLVALRAAPSGDTYVSVVDRGGVVVDVIATGDGYAVVEGGGLEAGDRVVVSGGDPLAGGP